MHRVSGLKIHTDVVGWSSQVQMIFRLRDMEKKLVIQGANAWMNTPPFLVKRRACVARYPTTADRG
jgi:hypothetical protein